jgi:hypothetical protein
MTTANHFQARDARDRIIDLLGLGRTSPLRDLPVRDEQLTVAFNTTAKIPIEFSQRDVLYQLYYQGSQVERTESGDQGPGIPVATMGNGGTAFIETHRILDDATFEILAKRVTTRQQAYLLETATVKVGLDTSLRAWIRSAPHLDASRDPTTEETTDTEPRIVDYGQAVNVVLHESQEGVDYRLAYFRPRGRRQEEVELSVEDRRGNLNDIQLHSQPIHEDVDILIRATKTFDPSENRPTQTTLLDVVLPLKVRANAVLNLSVLNVSVEPDPVFDHGQAGEVVISDTQPSARYGLFVRAIPDRDFIHTGIPNDEALRVPLDGEPDVLVRPPPVPAGGAIPPGFQAIGDFQPGTGGNLKLQLPSLTRDSLVVVQARKQHQAEPVIPSVVQLQPTAVVLVRPNPAPALNLMVRLEGAESTSAIEVFDGQPGVFYHFRTLPDGVDIGRPAYFHRRDEEDDGWNQGLGQLSLQVDLVVSRSRDAGDGGVDLAAAAPEAPLLEIGQPLAGTVLHVRAVKAQTRVGIPLAAQASIASLPEIRLEPPVVDYNATSRILVAASVVGDRYQAMLNGSPFKRARNGNGEDVSITIDAATEDTEYQVTVTRPGDPGIQVVRVVSRRLLVRPNPGLAVTPLPAAVDYGTATQIRVASSQNGVSYRLDSEGTAVGSAVAGNRGDITLPTAPLTENTTFSVRATRTASPEISVLLGQTAVVEVRPRPETPQ